MSPKAFPRLGSRQNRAIVGREMEEGPSYGMRCALNLTVTFVVEFTMQIFLRSRLPPDVAVTVASAAVVLAYLAGVRWIERRPITELTGSGSVAEFGSGLALGLALFSAVMAALWAIGIYRMTGWGRASAPAAGLPFAFLVAVAEEAIFRGLLFRLTSKFFGTWGALAITSVLFGTAHAFNSDATLRSSIAIGLEAGILLGAAYALTGRLWLPIGIHMGWDFAESSLFGMAMSSEVTPGALTNGTLRGPTFLTGGGFGPEASVVAVALCLAASVFLVVGLVRAGMVERPIWSAE